MKSTCSIEGCDFPSTTRGWCFPHYKRWCRHGDPQGGMPVTRAPKQCSVDGCEGTARGRGMCAAHYRLFLTHGDPLIKKCNANGEGNISVSGYRRVTIDGKRVFEHRAIMEQMIGRPLRPEERVHHLDRNRLNNDPSNLHLYSNQSEHVKQHGKESISCRQGHLWSETARYNALGRRLCMACVRNNNRVYGKKRRAKMRANG